MTGNDTDDDPTVEQHSEPDPADQPADGQSDTGILNPDRPDPSADGGTADSAATREASQTPGQAQSQASEAPTEEAPSGEGTSGDSRTSGERLAWLVQIGALVVLCLLALLATFRFYFAASQAIGVWISDDFVSVFQAAFNLLVLIASVYGVSVLVRRLG
jgi:hypothetical protein